HPLRREPPAEPCSKPLASLPGGGAAPPPPKGAPRGPPGRGLPHPGRGAVDGPGRLRDRAVRSRCCGTRRGPSLPALSRSLPFHTPGIRRGSALVTIVSDRSVV